MTDTAADLNVLQEAHILIRGERAHTYGPPHDNFAVIAELWSAYLRPKFHNFLADLGSSDRPHGATGPGIELLDENDVCNLMSLLKLAREASGGGFHRDSVVDVCGYQAIKEVLQGSREDFIAEITPDKYASEPVTKPGPSQPLTTE